MKDNKQQKTETVIFIPYTERSELKKQLQRWDDNMTKIQDNPRIRLVERANPWANI